MKATIKYYVDDILIFIKYQCFLIKEDIKKSIRKLLSFGNEMLTIKNYFYILFFILLFVLIKNQNLLNLIVIGMALFYLLYKRYKAGDHRAWDRDRKGYSIHTKEIKKKFEEEEEEEEKKHGG